MKTIYFIPNWCNIVSTAKAFVGIDTIVLSEFLVGMADVSEREAVADALEKRLDSGHFWMSLEM